MSVIYNTDWDVEKYRTEYESDEHWELKKSFIERHKDKFPEDEILCLAQVFFNVEFMGCRYPDETMVLVANLSKEVAEEFRASRKNRIKRTFVQASDAAEMRAKGSRNSSVNLTISQQKSIKPIQFVSSTSSSSTEIPAKKKKKTQEIVISDAEDDVEIIQDSVKIPSTKKLKKKLGHLLIYQHCDQPIGILTATAARNQIELEFNYPTPSKTKCILLLNKIPIAAGIQTDDKKSKIISAENALEKLRKICYTIKTLNTFFTRRDQISKTSESPTKDNQVNQINSSNLGFKLLKGLGWSGGALGKHESGIVNPIEVQIKIDRKGLGSQKLDNAFFKNILNEFKRGGDLSDLVFSSDFSNEERATLHSLARSFGLKSKSFGKRDDRQLVISKKITLQEIYNSLLNDDNKDLKEKYELISPTA